MKKIVAIIFLIIPSLLFSEVDYSFGLINSPLGNEHRINHLKIYEPANLLICLQNSEDTLYLLYYSTDKGNKWELRNKDAWFNQNSNYTVVSDNYMMSGWQSNFIEFMGNPVRDGGSWHSTDLGYTWSMFTQWPDPDDKRNRFLYCNIPNFYLLYNTSGIFSTKDKWKHLVFGAIPDYLIAIFNFKKKFLIVSESIGGMYYYDLETGFAIHWLNRDSNIPKERFSVIGIDNEGRVIGYSKANKGSEGIYMSDDSGLQFKKIRTQKEDEEIYVIETYKNAILIGTNKGMEVSIDEGKTWEDIKLPEIPVSDKSIYSISINKKTGEVYSIYGRNYIVKGILPFTSVEDNTVLQQITPNPAGDYIEIAVVGNRTLKNAVKVYDVLGTVVLSSPACSAGTPSEGGHIRLDVSGLAAGVYFVRVGGKMYKFVKL